MLGRSGMGIPCACEIEQKLPAKVLAAFEQMNQFQAIFQVIKGGLVFGKHDEALVIAP